MNEHDTEPTIDTERLAGPQKLALRGLFYVLRAYPYADAPHDRGWRTANDATPRARGTFKIPVKALTSLAKIGALELDTERVIAPADAEGAPIPDSEIIRVAAARGRTATETLEGMRERHRSRVRRERAARRETAPLRRKARLTRAGRAAAEELGPGVWRKPRTTSKAKLDALAERALLAGLDADHFAGIAERAFERADSHFADGLWDFGMRAHTDALEAAGIAGRLRDSRFARATRLAMRRRKVERDRRAERAGGAR